MERIDTRYEHWLISLHRFGIGPARRRLLRRQLGSAEAVFAASYNTLCMVPKITEEQASAIVKSRCSWDKECGEKYAEKGIRLVLESDAEFPARLKELPGAPDALYYKGHLPDDDIQAVSIVGARMCTSYGREIAKEYAGVLAQRGIQIISGLAYGVDGYAHQGALAACGATFGVLGCGVDVCYPRNHIDLYARMPQKGGLLSEYSPGTQPMPAHFPQRNRIISGLSDLVIVVEAKEKSGSLITADLALEQGRDVLAVPGRVGDVCSAGCNRLIAQGAGIAWTVDEVIKALELDADRKIAGRKAAGAAGSMSGKTADKAGRDADQTGAFAGRKAAGAVSSVPGKTADEAGADATDTAARKPAGKKACARQIDDRANLLQGIEKKVYDCLTLHTKNLEEIVEQVRLPVPQVLSALLTLQLKGYVQEIQRGHYTKTRSLLNL